MNVKTAKGIDKNVLDNDLKFEDQKNALSTDHRWGMDWKKFKANIII